jgi:hypothetical protein
VARLDSATNLERYSTKILISLIKTNNKFKNEMSTRPAPSMVDESLTPM